MTSCPNKGLCRRCKEPGHTAGQCTKAWNTAQVSVPVVAGPSSSGVSPAAPAPRPQRNAVRERAPPASVPDPFEETKMLLAEAMDTESVASDVDYPDSEVDKVDEAVSDGSNGISEYDTSKEDHLLEDVDLSLEKSRSASKRAKRGSGMECRNAPAPAVSSFAAAAPAALAVPAAPAAPASSAVQSSTPQCASGAPKGNDSDISSVSESTKPKTLNSEISSVNNSVEGNVEWNVENNVTTENIDYSSVNICSEASVTVGNSVQVDNNVGVAMATSFSSLSGPAVLSSSRVPAEVAVSPQPSGARTISTRKSRAARFSPMEGLAAIRQHSRTPPFSGRPKKTIVWWSWWSCFLPLVMALKVATLNINGLKDANKRMSFIQWLHFVDWDVLCLQESHVRGVRFRFFTWFQSFPRVGHFI